MLRRSDFIAATYALSFVFANFGIAIAAKMPMMTTTIRSSISVKPFFLLCTIVQTPERVVGVGGKQRVAGCGKAPAGPFALDIRKSLPANELSIVTATETGRNCSAFCEQSCIPPDILTKSQGAADITT